MRVFTTLCKDDKTGYQMILSECSYNMACDWLDKKCKKVGAEICRTEHNIKTNLDELWVAKWSDRINNYEPCRKYFYDEERGYLLGA